MLVPVVVAAYVSSRRRRARRAAALAAQGLVTTDVGRRLRWRRHVPFALFAAALAVLVVALARPMATVKTPRREATVILAIDVSNSMAATDVKPTRIEAAKTAAGAFVRQQPPAVRIGVVAFGDGRGDRAAADARPRRRARRPSIGCRSAGARRSARASSPRSTPSPARR